MKLWQKKTIENILKDHKKTIKKSLGQNYLLDQNIHLKIAEIVTAYPADHNIVEIGPGLGGLTQTFLERSDRRLIAVEIESSSYSILQDIFFAQNHFPDDWKERFKLFNKDIRDFNLAQHAPPPYVFVGNLPYNIATFIIIELLERYRGEIKGGVFMIQKEVAERFSAQPGDSDYSLISVIASASAQIKIVAHIPPASFYPAPKVDSALIHVMPHEKSYFDSTQHYLIFKTITKAAFRYRRKQITNAIKTAMESSQPILTAKDIQKSDFNLQFTQVEELLENYKSKRAEELSPQDYIDIARKIQESINQDHRRG